jgi:chemotaxis signal transduction protein
MVMSEQTPLRSDYCVFSRDGTTFALSTRVAKEVLDPRPFTPVPQAPPELIGAFNLRGEVIPLVRLDRFLGVAGRPLERTDTLLLLGDENVSVAVVVDHVTTIKHIAPWEIRRSKPADGGQSPFVRGMTGVETARTWVLDGELLLSSVADAVTRGFREPTVAGREES